MKICLRRAARISAERLISVQTDEQTEIDMETNMAVNMGDKSVYIRAFWPREISQSTSLRSFQSNRCYCIGSRTRSALGKCHISGGQTIGTHSDLERTIPLRRRNSARTEL